MTTTTDKKKPSGGSRPAPAGEVKRDRARNVVSLVAILAVLAALGCVAFFGYRAYDAYFVEKPTQQARDEAVSAAEQAMINVTTIDPARLDLWQRNFKASFTGDALKQVETQIQGTLIEPIRQSQGRAGPTTGRLIRSAPTEVNADAGTAGVLVFVGVTGTIDGKQSPQRTMGFLLTMRRVNDGIWRADTVTPLDGIPVSDPGQPTTTSPAPGGN